MKAQQTNRQQLSMRNMGRDHRTRSAKTPINIDGYQGAIEASNPMPFKGFVFMPEFSMNAETFGKTPDEVISNLRAKIKELQEIVPARWEAFDRIKDLLDEKFTAPFYGYQFLNARQKEWRAAPLARLHELIEILEGLEMPEAA